MSTMKSSIGVLICSSDSRMDILDRVLPSILKYWPDCPYPIYVGLNAENDRWPNIKSLVAEPSGWRQESLQQLAQISETHLIVILDDFLFQQPADQRRISSLVSQAVKADLPYLRLLPLGRSLRQRLWSVFHRRSAADVCPIAKRRPFYSALQIAVWNKAHFASLLELQGSIWDFEHQKHLDVTHYAITDRPPIVYRHLVEKGRWLPYAGSLLRVAGLSCDLGVRPTWTRWMNFRLMLDGLRFLVAGYANH
jgi:hypothetical protein